MNADARTRAWEYYNGSDRSHEADLNALATHPEGIVLLMPRLVVLMKPVPSSCPELWPRLELVFPEADAWYIHLLVGDVHLARRLAAALPPRQWLCFQRGRRNTTPHRLSWSAFLHQPLTQ